MLSAEVNQNQLTGRSNRIRLSNKRIKNYCNNSLWSRDSLSFNNKS